MRSLNNRLWERFVEAPPVLDPALDLAVERIDSERAVLRFRYDGGALELRARWLSVPYPSGLRRLLASDSEIEAVIVERIPRGLDAAAAELGVSYLDVRGAGRIVRDGLFYLIRPLPVPPRVWSGRDLEDEWLPDPPASPGVDKVVERRQRRQVDPFAQKASRVVRALLVEPDRRWRSSEIAAAVDVDPGNAHRVLSALVESDFLEKDEERYVLPDPGSLLDAWAERVRRPKEVVSMAVEEDLASWLRAAGESLGDGYVVSGEFAAELLAPHLSARNAIVHCCSDEAFAAVEEIARASNPSLRSSRRVEARKSEPGVAYFSASKNGVRLAAAVQVYLDLVHARGRGREAGDHLRRSVIGF